MKQVSSKVNNQLLLKVIVGVSSLLASFLIIGCNFDKSKPNIELVQDMMESPAIKPQEYDEASPNKIGMREPVKGTRPVGFVVEPLDDLAIAEKELKNPFAGDMSKDVLMTGQKYYQTNCTICHGSKAEGGVESKSSVAELMALKPPTLIGEKIVGWSDAHIYFVIAKGQGLMGPYNHHIPQKYRWQVVNYIRHLQKEAKQ